MCRAFTLIEILIVIAIIALLMSLIMAVITPRSAYMVKTDASIKKLELAVITYERDNGRYPLFHLAVTDFSDTNLETIASRNHDLREILSATNDEYMRGFESEISYSAASTAVLSSSPKTATCIVDAWDMPLVYKPYSIYFKAPMGWPATGPSRYAPPKRSSFQIWSAGENGIYEMNSGDADPSTYKPYSSSQAKDGKLFIDDIVSWKRPGEL